MNLKLAPKICAGRAGLNFHGPFKTKTGRWSGAYTSTRIGVVLSD